MAVPVRRGRWLVLIAFGLLVASTQLLWLSFAPISTQVHRVLGVSEGAVGDLAGIEPLIYVLLAIPTGRWTDRRFRSALSAGALLTAGGAMLRLVDPTSYGWVFAGQLVVSIGQPLVLNSTTKIAARYFPPPERPTAISIASAAQFVGILAAAMTGELLMNAGGLRVVLLVHAGVAVVAATGVILAARMPAAFAVDAVVAVPLGWLRRDRVLWLLGGLLFIGVGVFNAAATWLEVILSHFGQSGSSGTLIAIMTVAGIVGAAVLPGVAARWNQRRLVLMITVLVTASVFLAIAAVHNLVFISCVLAVEGFVLLAGLPVALEWSELHVGPNRAGTATGLLLLVGNLGGVVLVLVVQVLIGNPYLALSALSLVALPGLVFIALLPDRVLSPEEDHDLSTVGQLSQVGHRS